MHLVLILYIFFLRISFPLSICLSGLPQVTWAFSIYLEAGAILPQLFMVAKTGEAENITSHYLFALGIYRGLYILNWIYRYYTEGHLDLIAVVAGVIQTILYCDFFYLYVTKGERGCLSSRRSTG